MTESTLSPEQVKRIWARIYSGPKWQRWFWFFVYGADVAFHVDQIYGYDDDRIDLDS